MDNLVGYIEEFNEISIVIRLVLATLFGGIIGMERESRRHSAGFRTFTLVCIGSALATIANLYLWKITGSTDVSRISAAVISGIGFLGVGTIIITRKNQVRGLTTAAGLWATAALGVALGSGMICTSTLAFILIMVTISILRKYSWYVASHNRVMSIYAETLSEEGLDNIINYIKDHNYNIISLEKKKDNGSNSQATTILLEFDMLKNHLHQEVLADMSHIDGVHYLEES